MHELIICVIDPAFGLQAVNLGFDTDTTAAITGGLAGLYYGYSDIPEKWLQKIARREWIEELCDIDL